MQEPVRFVFSCELPLTIFGVLNVRAFIKVYLGIKDYINLVHHIKQLCHFRRLGVNCLINMDTFSNVFIDFWWYGLSVERHKSLRCNSNILVCVKDQIKSCGLETH